MMQHAMKGEDRQEEAERRRKLREAIRSDLRTAAEEQRIQAIVAKIKKTSSLEATKSEEPYWRGWRRRMKRG